jgi:hypothetical protein
MDFDEFTGTVTYIPNADFNGSDSFAFTVTDDDQAGLPHFRTSLQATVSINVAPVNKPPVAHPQLVATAETTPVTMTLSANDGDPEVTQALIFTITTPPQHGSLGALDPVTRQITYTPNPDYNGPDSFAFTVTDDHTAGAPANLTSAPATVTLSVTPVNAMPVAHAQNAATDGGHRGLDRADRRRRRSGGGSGVDLRHRHATATRDDHGLQPGHRRGDVRAERRLQRYR